eukprot:TRINITY_DN2816_c0_g1_i4.p2 TRINITY_DN2816_c0_g1~~TRINITY_DN2816_c0_g1_i4.p2  ORF type:complete len:156 (-),score=62.98 TRINITY_DN2816_c0_g1_i4:40-507(-)
MLVMKRKQYQEKLLAQAEAQLGNIQQLVDTIEFKLVEAKVFEQLRLGTETLNKLNSQMSLEDVERLMDETAEAVAYQREVEEALQGQLQPEDTDAVLEELERLQTEVLLEGAAAVPTEVPVGNKTAASAASTSAASAAAAPSRAKTAPRAAAMAQ